MQNDELTTVVSNENMVAMGNINRMMHLHDERLQNYEVRLFLYWSIFEIVEVSDK